VTTQTIMKARIADELARTDLTSQIAYSITDAIAAYANERFWFNESRTSVSFSTVDGQEFYTSSDDADIASIRKLDYAVVYVGNDVRKLEYNSPEDMEYLSANGTQEGTPWSYGWYDNKLRLYPVPDAVYTIRIAAHVKVAAPATDGEASNPWMTDAERLIRSRAKLELALHVLRDDALAATMAEAVKEAWSDLKSTTNMLFAGDGRITAMEF
jgi:hypothetical protein